MKKQATTEFSGKIMKRWYGVHKGGISVAWAETKEIAMGKFKKNESLHGSIEKVLPAPSAIEEVRPLRKNIKKNVAAAV